MRALVLFGLSLVVSASTLVEIQTNYHESVGIPNAKKIWDIEQDILAEKVQENRIIGGVLAPANAHPHFAGLLISLAGTHLQSVCGSSLLSPSRIVTAAHCWRDINNQATEFLVILGSNFLWSGGERMTTRQVFMHPEYNVQFFTSDIAMAYLPRPATLHAGVRPIRLPRGSELSSLFVGQWAVAAGFGKTSDQQQAASTLVSHVSLQVTSHDHCEREYGSAYVKRSTLCTNGAGGVGICSGDSGGPLAARGSDGQPFLIGVTSFAAQVCQAGLPSGFARVTSFYSWIMRHM